MSPLGLGFPTYEQGLCAANGRKLAGPPLGEQVRIAEAATRGEQDLNYLPDCWQLDLLCLCYRAKMLVALTWKVLRQVKK